MRMLFEIDTQDYDLTKNKIIRPSVRSIIIKNELVAMIHSLKFDYYKFPGGGMEEGETQIDTLMRETLEETGLIIIPSTIREYGSVHRIQRHYNGDVFTQDNYYYLCDITEGRSYQRLDDYELYEMFTLEFVDPKKAIKINREHDHGPKDQVMVEREASVLECLINDHYFD